MSKSIQSFVNFWNNDQTGKTGLISIQPAKDWVGEVMSSSFIKQYADKRASFFESRENTVSISQLGRPLISLALTKINYFENKQYSDLKLRYIFATGDFTETLVLALAQIYGLEVTDYQKEVEIWGVKGHIDAVVEDTLIDVKSMSASSYISFVKNPYSNPGYVTQLALYKFAMKIKKAGWLCICKPTGEMSYVRLPEYSDYIREAYNKIQILDKINNIQDVYRYCKPPEPTPEVVKQVRTGKFVMPDVFKFEPEVRNFVYPSEDGVYVDMEKYTQFWNKYHASQ